jgi:hypothetical protein
MYSIATVIYGVPLTEKILKKIDEWEDQGSDKWHENSDGPCGFTKLYSGSSHAAGYCGIRLDEFDEACDFVDPSKLKMKPTKSQMSVAKEFYKNLDPELQKLCEPLGVYFVWSTS